MPVKNDTPKCQSTTGLNLCRPGSRESGAQPTPAPRVQFHTHPACSDTAKTQTKLEIVLSKAEPRSCFSTHGSTNHWQSGKKDAAGFLLVFFFSFLKSDSTVSSLLRTFSCNRARGTECERRLATAPAKGREITTVMESTIAPPFTVPTLICNSDDSYTCRRCGEHLKPPELFLSRFGKRQRNGSDLEINSHLTVVFAKGSL